MSERNTHHVGRTIVLRIATLIRRASSRLFRQPDERAARHGLQVTVRRRGWARTYRDPRFDRCSRCGRCVGTGIDTMTLCRICNGTGRLVRDDHARVDS